MPLEDLFIPMAKTAGDKEKRGRYTAPALEKGLDVLELLSSTSEPLSKSDIARRLGRTSSEVFRMLICLEERGFIAQNDAELYHLTLKLFEMAQRHPPTKRLIHEALPVMHDLASITGQSCHLGVIEDGVVSILAQVDAPGSIGFFVKPGASIDLMHAATGFVILAYLEQHLQSRAIEDARRKGSRIPADLMRHLVRIREQGHEERASYQAAGIVNLSAPILDTHGNAIAALTIPFLPRLDHPSNAKTALRELKQHAALLSRLTGYNPQLLEVDGGVQRRSRLKNK